MVEHPTAGPFVIDAGVSARHVDDGGGADLGRVGVPLLCPDVRTYPRSLDELRAYVDQTPDAFVLPGHDAERWDTDSAVIANA